MKLAGTSIESVKEVRVHYPPQAKLPAHAHPQSASAYVHLSDSGPVVDRRRFDLLTAPIHNATP